MADSKENRGAVVEPINFAAKFAKSDLFLEVFEEGMTLVEQAANYLDTQGRDESRDLPRSAALGYATESMRLTTRLMQLASWLLLQRAVNEGEISAEDALDEKRKVTLGTMSNHKRSESFEDLPAQLRDLIQRSMRLEERILTIDEVLGRKKQVQAGLEQKNPLADQMAMLQNAFGKPN
jgi:regulator of CtrA degradation